MKRLGPSDFFSAVGVVGEKKDLTFTFLFLVSTCHVSRKPLSPRELRLALYPCCPGKISTSVILCRLNVCSLSPLIKRVTKSANSKPIPAVLSVSPPGEFGRLGGKRGRTCAAKRTPTNPDPRCLLRVPQAPFRPLEPVRTTRHNHLTPGKRLKPNTPRPINPRARTTRSEQRIRPPLGRPPPNFGWPLPCRMRPMPAVPSNAASSAPPPSSAPRPSLHRS